MMRQYCLHAALVVFFAGSAVATSNAQPLGTILEESALEVGIRFKNTHVDLRRSGDFELDRKLATTAFRFGFSEATTLLGEVAVGNENLHSIK